ncbi:unnamed protein product [Rotaria sordida]|uniref:Death domain-containing protein n=1 Tax=Rotaria sordida TaxID=392033 RepID=A0A813Y4Z7_9BILA|nr:unnamed protein product [Rotaria sordida]CAF0875707.1 unnamed protein product [Rotaria sordida]
MDEIIKQLTHDNNLLEQQWSDIFSRIEEASIPNDSKLILNALVDYLLTEPIDSLPCLLKYLLITMVIEQLIKKEVSIEINDLINVFIRILDSSRVDRLYLKFLETIYKNFEIGERLCSTPIKTDLIEKILQSLQKKTFVFNSNEDTEKWETFLTQTIFSNSTNDMNILNKQDIIEEMKANFQQFYKHAVQQSQQSSVWLKIATILNESSSKIFTNETSWNMILSDTNLSIENISFDCITQLIQSYKNDNELIKIGYTKFLTIFERLILVNNYDDAYQLSSNIIIPNLSITDLEILFCTIIRLCPIVEHRDLFCSRILDSLILALANLQIKKNLAIVVFDLALAILKLCVYDAPDLSYSLLRRNDFYPWQELINGLVDLVKTCISYDVIIENNFFSKLDQLENIIDLIYRKIQAYPIISKVIHPISVEAVLRWSNIQYNGSHHVYRMGNSIMNLIDLRQINEDICMKFIDAIQTRVHCDNEEINIKSRLFFNNMSQHLGEFIVQLKRLSHNIHSKLATLFLSLLDYSFYDEDHNMTFHYVTLISILYRTASCIFNENDARLYEPFLDRMYINVKDDNETMFHQIWVNFWLVAGVQVQTIAANHIEQFLDHTFNRKDMCLSSLLLTLSVQHTELFYSHFDDLVNILFTDNGQYLTNLFGLFLLIVKKYPEIVSSKHIDYIFSSIETISFSNELCIIIQTLSCVANYHPYLFDRHCGKIICLIIEKQNLLIFECFRNYILSSIIINNENKANEYLNILTDILKNKKCSNEIQQDIFYTCILIGLKYKQLLINRRYDFKVLGSNLIVNYIDNATISELDQTTIKQAQLEIEKIELCINKTKMNIKTKQLNTNNIPSWSYQVSKLLNNPSNNDWRLLSKQLGFSCSEIKHWSMQTNPCMALLNEWFITHTTEEAIYSLIKVLNDIGRHDVEQIIRQEVLKTGQTIPNDLSVDIKRLPPVFLSFHSNEQIRVTKLKDHLEKAGYAGQMYDEQTEINILESLIRGSKVIVCCINILYDRSENCSKVFHLILNMKKPFILLYMEEQTWPSESKLKSILDDFLYIEFYNDTKVNDWPENKFIELLSQIRYHVAPDPDMIREQYHHWFVPRLDNLIFLKLSNEQKQNNSISFNDIPLVVSHPQIIISYQWDCQKDVLNLYKQLTQLGYRIWLNIFQMGGGDSLLDKYNIAIQQSLCLLVCITPKYMKSINCQREISLANTFHKPIIPLLLEETNTWPPSDLILSIFVHKSYIDFRHSNGYDRWTEKQFVLLLAQLKKIIPNVETDKPRHLLEMQRPISASRHSNNNDQRSKRISSAPIIPKSQACSLM